MRILMVTNNWVPYSGGVVSSIMSTVDLLQARGHDVYIVTLDFSGVYDDPPYVYRVPSLFTMTYKHNSIAIPWRKHSFLMQHIEKLYPDVVHIHHPFLLGTAALRCAKKYGIPVIFTYHSFYEKYAHYLSPLPCAITAYAARVLSMRCARAVHHVIVPSNCIATYIKKYNVKTSMTVLPSPIPSYFFSAMPHKKITMPLKLLYVGRFVQEKNIHFLFDVVARLQVPYTFTLVGYGYTYDLLQQYAFETLGLSKDIIKFVIRPLKQELVRLYRDAHLKLFASQSETQGLVLAEAMASGTPVIALSGPGVDDIVQSGVNGYRVQTKDEMIERIESIVDNAMLYRDLCSGAQKTAQAYTQENIGVRLEKVYHFV